MRHFFAVSRRFRSLLGKLGAYTISAQLFFVASRFAPQQKRGVSNEMLTEKTSLLDEEGA